ncbi:tripartite tricarboxylate transporter permease [Jhaorihella thermophila]
MDPIVGLTVLLGIYGSSMYGGSIPAVLINTPRHGGQRADHL